MNILRHVQTVLWSFVGLGRRKDFDEVTSRGRPVQLVVVAIVLALLFVVALVALAMFAVRSVSTPQAVSMRAPVAAQVASAASTAGMASVVATSRTVPDTIETRVAACTACHGKEGRATNDGYFPRIAGKPAGYLFNQLVNFREGRRNYAPMTHMVEYLSDDYLREIAGYFSGLDLPYPAAQTTGAAADTMARGMKLVREGDTALGVPACAACHGAALTGVAPAIPGLLGLPRDYINGQLGAWRAGARQAHRPDCMASVATRLAPEDIAAASTWLSSQALPADTHPAGSLPQTLPLDCGVAVGATVGVALGVALDVRAEQAIAGDAAALPTAAPAGEIERGRYLATAGNCAGCHTVRGGAPMAGGLGIETPFGTVFSSNLTPDAATGIGGWSADHFWRAMHDGRSKDGRLLYPAFPYPNYTQVTREDSDAIYAFLRSVPAVAQRNRAHDLRFPFDTQLALVAWRALFFEPGSYEPVASQSAEWNRGAYLVRGLGHCVACHSARNVFGATSEKLELSGGLIPVQNWYAPSLNDPLEAGVADWDTAQVVSLLKSGVSPRGSVLGPMAEVVSRSTQHLSDADLASMATFLKQLPRVATAPAVAVAAATVGGAQREVGAAIYGKQCAQCHGERGEGAPGAYPALAGNRAVTMATPVNLVRIVLAGGFLPSTAGNPRPYGMPPFAQVLSNSEVAAVVSFIRGSWGNAAAAVSEVEVLGMREGR